MNIQQMMKRAQQMQDQLQQQAAQTRVEASAGGGMVTVVMNGLKQVEKITLDPEAVSKDDVEMLQDMISPPSPTRTARPTRSSSARWAACSAAWGFQGSDAVQGSRDRAFVPCPSSLCSLDISTPASSSAAPGPHRRAPAAARHRRQERPATGLPPAEEPARGRRSPHAGRDADVKERVSVLLDLQQHHRHRPLQHLHERRARAAGSSASSRIRRT